VQPAEILEFYRDLTEIGGYEMETAGVLKNGRKLWALARTGQSVTLKGSDTVNGYLLLVTACDGTLATTAQFTSVRVVCNNTLAIALRGTAGTVKVPHRRAFDAQAVKQQLGVAITPWSSFCDHIKELANCRVAEKTVEGFLTKVFAYGHLNTASHGPTFNEHAAQKVLTLYTGQGKGSGLSSAKGTAWGLLNSVTEYLDHHRRSRSNDYRRDAAWFGQGAMLKQRAWGEMLQLIA
jgi:phage/plasmid-like protein (TIGR03299 family)